MSAFANEREANIHFARVNLAMSRAFRIRALPRCHYHWSLLESAANARRRAMFKPPEQVQHVLPIQQELFA